MLIKFRTKEDIDRVFNMKFGVIRFKKFAIIKRYSYKEMFKELLWYIADIPVRAVVYIFNILLYLLNFIPRIYIEKDSGSDMND